MGIINCQLADVPYEDLMAIVLIERQSSIFTYGGFLEVLRQSLPSKTLLSVIHKEL